MVAEVNSLVLDNHRNTVDEIHWLLGISVGTTHTMIDHLNFRKMCTQWVPHQLTTEQRNTRMMLSLSLLQRYPGKEYGFLPQIFLNDETRYHRFEPKIKHQSKQWKLTTSPPPKKSKAEHTSSGKVMMSFFDRKGPLLLVEFLE
ncbi:histone-lysine N-methyltransferase SETMAR [Trichonephila clavipes]|nr:histone-lysine N-methyltransferase SETMAR [Trichonephila clavipes]